MKKNFVSTFSLPFFVLGFFILASCSKSPTNNYRIEGSIPADDSSKMVYLGITSDTIILDSCLVTGGKYFFEGYVDTVVQVTITTNASSNKWSLFLEPDTMILSDSTNIIQGGQLNRFYNIFFPTLDKAAENSDDAKTAIRNELRKFWKAHYNDAFGALVLRYASSFYETDEMETFLQQAGDDIQNNPTFLMVKHNVQTAKLTEPGAMFVDGTFLDLQGKSVRLSDYIGRGNYVIMDCWASWCGPCRELIPTLKEMILKYKGKNVEVIGVATRDKVADTKRAVEELQIPWTVLSDYDAPIHMTKTYGFQGIPFLMFFAPDGTIIYRNASESDIDEYLNQHIK